MGRKKNVILPPDLPAEIGEEDIEVSDEDFEFVKSNQGYAGFLKNLDTKSINRHVTRVADMKEDDLEALYERRNRKSFLQKPSKEEQLQVDSVDALPVKTLDGELYYRTDKEHRSSAAPEYHEADKVHGDVDKSIVRLTKPERRQKLKKSRKEAKRQAKEEVAKVDAAEINPHAEVLESMEKLLSAEEAFVQKKNKLAELGISLLEDPDTNIKCLKELIQFCKDGDKNIVKLALLSSLAIFKDIIPGYRIRLPTEKEQEMNVSKAVKKMRFYEYTLLHSYKAYLLRLIALEKKLFFRHVAVRCMCSLLDAVPHFNFRENLLASVIKNISSPDDVVRRSCCSAIRSIFANEGKHGGEVTVEAVQLIANHVKIHDCQLHPDSIEVFLSLTFDEDIGKDTENEKNKFKKGRWKQNHKEVKPLPDKDKKFSRQELTAKTRDEVRADLKAASFVLDSEERRTMQTQSLNAIFETYFRILKDTIDFGISRSTAVSSSAFVAGSPHPLLAPCLRGLAKFSHLIDLKYMSVLMGYLKELAGQCGYHDRSSSETTMSVSECMQCCVVAFKVMRNNLDALNVDLHDFYVVLYNLLLEYRPLRDQGEVLAEALKIMLCEGKQHDMQRAAAFIKRLASFSLCFGSSEAMAALLTLKQLLQKNSKCRNLLENDAGGGSLSGLVVKYQPDATDPNLSGALASVLWELNLLTKHYHPSISSIVSSISSMSGTQTQVYLTTSSPQQAFTELSIERETFKLIGKPTLKRKRKNSGHVASSTLVREMENPVDEDDLRSRFEHHFTVVKDISENKRLRGELTKTLASISLYEEYKKQKKRKRVVKSAK